MTEQEFRNTYPSEIIELMLKRQEEQGNPRNIEPFLETIHRSKFLGGFSWGITKEGFNFWEDVLLCLNFDLFYKTYPPTDKVIYLCQKMEKMISHLEKEK